MSTALPVQIPPNFVPVVSVGDSVSAGQVIAKLAAGNEQVVNIPQELGIPLSNVRKVLKKVPGDIVAVGDTIAVKKNFFGREEAAILSKVEGKIARYERATGNLIIRTSYDTLTENIISPVDGTIALCDNEQIVIQKEPTIKGLASGENGEGELFILEQSFSDESPDGVLFHMDSQAIGKIVVGGNFTRELLVKGISIGATGIIGIGIREEDIRYLKQRNMNVPVLAVDTRTIEKLVKWRGKRVMVDAVEKTISLVDVSSRT